MIVTSIDFETANYSDVSICAAGIAVFDDGKLLDSKHWLVRPPKDHGWFREDFIECHGIQWQDVRHAPEFPDIAPEILDRLTRSEMVIAHNAAFDMRKLLATMEHFNLTCPEIDVLCTLCASRQIWPGLPSHGLGMLAAHIGHAFQHHNAQDDAETAGRVLYDMMRETKKENPRQLARAANIILGKLSARGYSGCRKG